MIINLALEWILQSLQTHVNGVGVCFWCGRFVPQVGYVHVLLWFRISNIFVFIPFLAELLNPLKHPKWWELKLSFRLIRWFLEGSWGQGLAVRRTTRLSALSPAKSWEPTLRSENWSFQPHCQTSWERNRGWRLSPVAGGQWHNQSRPCGEASFNTPKESALRASWLVNTRRFWERGGLETAWELWAPVPTLALCILSICLFPSPARKAVLWVP